MYRISRAKQGTVNLLSNEGLRNEFIRDYVQGILSVRELAEKYDIDASAFCPSKMYKNAVGKIIAPYYDKRLENARKRGVIVLDDSGVKENIIDSEFTKVKQIVELLNSEDIISYNFDTNKFEISKAFMRKYCEKKIRNYAKQLEHDNKTSLSHLIIDFT